MVPAPGYRDGDDPHRAAGETAALAPSEPLYQLIEHAPPFPDYVTLDDVKFSFSNDASAPAYERAMARVDSPAYQQATNRTAVIVGEGSLMAALHMIPEDTIILLDKSPEMCAHMGRYVTALHEADTVDEWVEHMGAMPGRIGHVTPRMMDALGRLKDQLLEWQETGYPHPLLDNDDYADAQGLVRQKAIIPWQGDMEDAEDMDRLGEVLRSHDAHVTMINITNAAGSHTVNVEEAQRHARMLGRLPVTPDVPILASSYQRIGPAHPNSSNNMMASVGPFFGLKDLAVRGSEPVSEIRLRRGGHILADMAILGALAQESSISVTTDANGEINGVSIVITGSGGIPDLSHLPPEIRKSMEDMDF